MQRLDTGSVPGNRLLNVVISRGTTLFGQVLREQWLNGDLAMDVPFAFLERQTGIEHKHIGTVLAFLEVGGYLKAEHGYHTHCARIELNLPAGAQLV